MKKETAWTMAKELTESLVQGKLDKVGLQTKEAKQVADFISALAQRLQNNYQSTQKSGPADPEETPEKQS
jgi:hypothetical protein